MTAPDSPRDDASNPPLSYPAWLLGQDYASLAGLLGRLHSRGAIDLLAPTPLSELGSTARGASYYAGSDTLAGAAGALDDTLLDSASIRFLSAIELLVLHAGFELDATHDWISASDIIATATELLDIAGTPAERRPSQADLLAAMRSCASWGLIYGPRWSLSLDSEHPSDSEHLDELLLKLPGPLTTMFHPSVRELWRLADCNRCPIPTAELPDTVEALPDRQRRLLSTLNNAGGVGHSESLRPGADPDQPLPTLVRTGILDQIDENTARLSGRVAQYLRGTLIAEPGGDFRPARPVNRSTGEAGPHDPAAVEDSASEPSTTDPNSQASATAVANVTQTIQDLTELLEELGSEPIQPLMSGGIGVREMNRIARRWGTDSDEVARRLTLAYEAGLVDLGFAHPPAGDGPVWAPTEPAMDFLEASLATQWAMLLLGWHASPYAPWHAEALDVRAFQEELLDPNAAHLRQLFPFLFRTPTGATTTTAQLADQLWRVQPFQAWGTTAEGLEAIVAESVDLGLTALGEPTAALSALKLAREAAEARAARSAAAAAHAPDDVSAAEDDNDDDDPVVALAASLDELLPSPVKYLIIQGDHTVMAPGLLAPADAAMLRAMAVQESSGIASVWRITKASLQSAFRTGHRSEEVSEFLSTMTPGGLPAVPQSIRYLIEDAERGLELSGSTPEDASASGRSSVPHRLQGRSGRHSDSQLREAIAAEIESYRRAASVESEAHEGDEVTLTEPRAALSALRQAYAAGHQVRLSYAEADGSTVSAWISVVMVTASQITAVTEPDGETFTVHPHRVIAVSVPSR
ncbi:helicase-associated domain-containing protein [Corynebacterium sp. UMB4614]|uniref:helicase-associated domain-containing protein n=1 Tax=Corynebacterium sp. UMB4614 TaxID=3046334 RepID=UPI00254EA47B|nr:helicase-associated domain-containing protein [Corynebacterium sp. UMB4614]MDK7135712.1 helicase-associated domain-containing protein [Corynebacterium sp. UMB4614]